MARGPLRPPGGGSDGDGGLGEPAARLFCSLPLARSASLRAAYVSRLIGGRHVRSAVAAQPASGGRGEQPRRKTYDRPRAPGRGGRVGGRRRQPIGRTHRVPGLLWAGAGRRARYTRAAAVRWREERPGPEGPIVRRGPAVWGGELRWRRLWRAPSPDTLVFFPSLRLKTCPKMEDFAA